MRMIPWIQYKKVIYRYIYLDDLEEFLFKVIKHFNPFQIILFGSLVSNHYHWESDADIFILFDHPINISSIKHRLLSYNHQKENMIDVFPYDVKEFMELSERKDLFLYHALKNSVCIYNKNI